MLDSSRFISQIAEKFQLNNKDIEGYVVGEHGDMQFILWSQLRIKNIIAPEYCRINNDKWDGKIMNDIHLKNKSYGAKIIEGKNFTNYGIASCVLYLVDSLLNDNEIVVSICCEMTGEFDIDNVAMSLPTTINRNGIKNRKMMHI